MKDNLDEKEKYLEYYKDSPLQHYACMYIGKSEDTIIRWKKADADFANRVEAARAEWVRGKIKKARVEFALERMEHEVFGEKKSVDITSGGQPIPILGQINAVPEDPGPTENPESNQTD